MERGVAIAGTTKGFFVEVWHHTIAPGHQDFIKNLLTGASQADVALFVGPVVGRFKVVSFSVVHQGCGIPTESTMATRIF